MPDIKPKSMPGTRPKPRYERRANHILDNYYIGQHPDPNHLSIWGYTDAMSYTAGDRLQLHVSTSADDWQLSICRDHLTPEVVYQQAGIPGAFYHCPEDASVNGCGWPVALTLQVDPAWQSGVYVITFTGFRGEKSVTEHHMFVVRPSQNTAAKALLLCATGTWLAYNCWGGSSAYEGITGEQGDQFSPYLSWQRPWTRGFCKLPKGAPRAVAQHPPTDGEMVRYPYMEWAYAYGYSKKYASAGWASYERHFIHWAEQQGMQIDVATLHDLHADARLLDAYQCVISVGHDEYWSAAMRHGLDKWIESGGNLARFAGNYMWQVRIENAQQVCFKYLAKEQDPVQDQFMSGAWDEPAIAWPGAHTIGANALQGIYANVGRCAVGSCYHVYQPEHWVFTGCDLQVGEAFAPHAGIYGYEVDGLQVNWQHGTPVPSGLDGADRKIQILAMGPASNVEDDQQVWGETCYLGDSDAQWLLSSDARGAGASMEDVATGNGVMLHWRRGQGQVFNAATCEWVMGLTRKDSQVEQVTLNVLQRFMS